MRATDFQLFYHQGLLEESKGITVSTDEWKQSEATMLLSSSKFRTCIAVVAVLKQLDDSSPRRAIVYLYHRQARYDLPKTFMADMLEKGVETVHVFSKTADIKAKHHHLVPELIGILKSVVHVKEKELGKKLGITFNKIEVPTYTLLVHSPEKRSIALGVEVTTNPTVGKRIFMDASQALQVLSEWAGENGEDDLDEEAPNQTRFFDLFPEAKQNPESTLSLKAQLMDQMAKNICHHQAEEGNDEWLMKVYKALARILRCNIVVVAAETEPPIRIKPMLTKQAEAKAIPTIYLQKESERVYKRLPTLKLEDQPIEVMATKAAQDMTQEEFFEAVATFTEELEPGVAAQIRAMSLEQRVMPPPKSGRGQRSASTVRLDATQSKGCCSVG